MLKKLNNHPFPQTCKMALKSLNQLANLKFKHFKTGYIFFLKVSIAFIYINQQNIATYCNLCTIYLKNIN